MVFVTSAGARWDAAQEGAAASFEVDGVSRERRSGWSVLARGVPEAVTDDEIADDDLDALDPLAGGDRDHVVRLSIDDITRRRIPPDAAWARAHREHHTWTGRDASDPAGLTAASATLMGADRSIGVAACGDERGGHRPRDSLGRHTGRPASRS